MANKTTPVDRRKWQLPLYFTVGAAAVVVLIAGLLAYQAWRAIADTPMLLETDQAQETSTFWAVAGLLYPGQRFSKEFDMPGIYIYFSLPGLSPSTTGTIIIG